MYLFLAFGCHCVVVARGVSISIQGVLQSQPRETLGNERAVGCCVKKNKKTTKKKKKKKKQKKKKKKKQRERERETIKIKEERSKSTLTIKTGA